MVSSAEGSGPAPREVRTGALLAWRETKLAAGVKEALLPSKYDLRLLADEPDVRTSALMETDNVRRWEHEIVAAWSLNGAPAAPDTPVRARERPLQVERDGLSLTVPVPTVPDPSPAVAPVPPYVPQPGPVPAPAPEPASDGPLPAELPAPVAADAPPTADAGSGKPPGPDDAEPGGAADEPPPDGLPRPEDFAPCRTPFWTDLEADTIRMRSAGARQMLSWPEAAGEYVVYRVATAGDGYPAMPEESESTVVSGTAWTDVERVLTRPEHPIQWVRVWANAGDGQDAALAAQPVLVAQKGFVTPPTRIRHQVAGRQVALRWLVDPAVEDVEVHRLRAGSNVPLTRVDVSTRVLSGAGPRDSYQDDAAPYGSWEYRVYALADVGEALTYSPAAVCRLTVAAPLAPVTELRLDRAADGTLRVEWDQTEAGTVTVHATATAINPGLRQAARPDGALTQEHEALALERELPFAVHRDGRVEWIERVQLPDPGDAGGHYLTAVTRRDGQAWVGDSVFVPCIRPVADLQLHERVDAQLLTFAIPDGAKSVHVFVTGPGEELDLTRGEGPIAEVDHDDYRRAGRITLTDLSQGWPCRVHVVPIFNFNPPQFGPVSPVEYPGLVRIVYRFATAEDNPQLGARPTPRHRLLEARNLSPQEVDATFYVCHNRHRLPLFVEDGETLPIARGGGGLSVQVSLPEKRPVPVTWVPFPAEGFVRAFVVGGHASPGSPAVALLDAEPAALRCHP